MTRILYGVSPIGLGHASRAVAIGLKLRVRGLEPEFATGGPAVPFIASYGFKVLEVVSEPTPSESAGVMKYPALWYLRYWRGYRSTLKRMASLISKVEPDIVVGDEEFSCVSLAIERGIQNVMISDELELGFAKGRVARYVEERVMEWYRDLQQRTSHLLVPDFGQDSGNTHYTTPVVREVTKDRDETLSEYHLPTGKSLVLFSASGSGIGRFLARATVNAFVETRLGNTLLAIAGMEWTAPSTENIRCLGLVRDNQNLIAAADLVVSTAGKSTIDEAASSGTPMIAIPIKNHSEQERNASAIGFRYEDLHKLDSLIPRFLAGRREPRNYQGAEKTASYLAKLVG